MLSSSQNYAGSSSNPMQGFPLQGFPNSQGFLANPLQDATLHSGSDLNNPELFKQNIQMVQDQLLRLQGLARNALTGIQNAYHTGNSPTQTEADINTLKQTLFMLTDMMRQTGVGALPLLSTPPGAEGPAVPTEQQLVEETTRAVKVLYEQLSRHEDSASVVANLLGSEHVPKGGR